MFAKAFLLSSLLAQTSQEPPHPIVFDVSSVKPSNGTEAQAGIFRLEAGNVSVGAMTLAEMIELFYNIRPYQLDGGQEWTRRDRFNVTGKDSVQSAQPRPEGPAWVAALAANHVQMRLLLADRFGLRVHEEARTLPPLTLTVLPGRKFVAAACDTSYRLQHEWIEGAMHISSLAALLKAEYGMPVTDATGLPDCYQLNAKWSSNPRDTYLPELATALHDLGFGIKKSKGPVQVLVIDQAEHPKPD